MSETLTILVVDDDPSMANSLADILDVKGFKVHAAYCGAEALEVLRDHPVDVMLADVIMPDMNGVELHRATRKTHPDLCTFIMTGYSADAIIQEGMADGIKAVFIKPVDIDLMVSIFSAVKRES